MVIKILSSTATFNGVKYNTDKIDSGKGELIKVQNFGHLNAFGKYRPEDYKTYLKAVSALNGRVKNPQFHVAISTKGREHNKHELTEIAERWLKEMGYGNQPYLIVFHKDTDNNHVHVVSCRVDKNGQKIRDSYEKNRGIAAMNRIMGVDEQKMITDALKYRFSTLAQFKLILEQQGFKIRETNGKLAFIRSGKKVDEVLIDAIKFSAPDKSRQQQLKALFHKYGEQELKDKFGIRLVFHAKDDKPAYGYTISIMPERMCLKAARSCRLLCFSRKGLQKPSIHRTIITRTISKTTIHWIHKFLCQRSTSRRMSMTKPFTA